MMEVKPTLAYGLQKSVGTLWKDNHSCDFTVVVDDKSFQCHRNILSACSGFFEGLFRSQMKECLENHVKVGGMTANTFDVIINSVYGGVDGLTADNVWDVWSATEQLQIRDLTEKCENFAIENVSVDNYFSILRHAKMYSAGKVETHILEFVSENFEQVRNMEDILELPFDYFYRVIESDHLKSSSEDVVVETVLKWVNYTHDSSDARSRCEELDATSRCEELDDRYRSNIDNTNNEKLDEAISNDDKLVDSLTLSHVAESNTASDTSSIKMNLDCNATIEDGDNETNHAIEASPNSACAGESQKGMNDNQSTLPGTGICQTGSFSECVKNSEKSPSAKVIPGHCKRVCKNNNLAEVESEREERKQHLFKLFSVCRLCLISSPCLNNLFHSDVLLSCKEAYNLVTEAMMYKLCVGRRDAPWPEAAVHRVTSDMKHVVVFLSDKKFMAYNLSTGIVKEFLALPWHFDDLYTTITVFDNAMYMCSNKDSFWTLRMFTKEKRWDTVNKIQTYGDTKLLVHGNHMFYFSDYNNNVYSFNCHFGHIREWIYCTTINKHVDVAVAFQQYILMFYTEGNAAHALCYITETKDRHISPTSMSGTSEGMTSFSHLGDVFLLQRDGSLWKICSTDTAPVYFKSVSKLWNEDLDLRGSVVYRKELFVFYHEIQPSQLSVETNLESVRDLFKNIKIVSVESDTPCLPMVLPESWLIHPI